MAFLPLLVEAGAGLMEAGLAAWEGIAAAEGAVAGVVATAEELAPLIGGLRGAAASTGRYATMETGTSNLGGLLGATENLIGATEAHWAGTGVVGETLGPTAELLGIVSAPKATEEVLKQFKRELPKDMKQEAMEQGAEKRSFHVDDYPAEQLEDVTKYFTQQGGSAGGYLPGSGSGGQSVGGNTEMSNGGTINNPGVEKDCYQIDGGAVENLFPPVRTTTHKYFFRNQVSPVTVAANVLAPITLGSQIERDFVQILEIEPNNWMKPVYRCWMHGNDNSGTVGGYQAMTGANFAYAPSLTDIWATYYKFTQVIKSEFAIEFIHAGGYNENHARPFRLYRFDNNNDVPGEIPAWGGGALDKAPLNMMHPRFNCISGIIGPGFSHGFASSGDDSAFMSSYKNSHTDTITYSANTNVEDPIQDTKQVEWTAIGVAPNVIRRTSYYVSGATNSHVGTDTMGCLINIRIMASFTIAWRNTLGDTFFYTLNTVPMAEFANPEERIKLLKQVQMGFDPKYSVDYTKHRGKITVLPDHVLQANGIKRELEEDPEHLEPQKRTPIEEV